MAKRSWAKTLGTAAGVGALAGAGQLGVAYGLGIVRWGDAFTSRAAWHTQLTWLAFIAAVATVAGAGAAMWAPTSWTETTHAQRSSLTARFGLALAGALGSAATIPLAIGRSRGVGIPEPGTAGHLAVLAIAAGIVLGIVVALAALTVPAVAGNVITYLVWLWLAALLCSVWSLGRGTLWATAQLGLLPPAGGWTATVLLLGAPAVIAFGASSVARFGGGGRIAIAASGAAGPALVAGAYLVGGRGGGTQTVSYWCALLGVGAGAAVSAFVSMARRRPSPTVASHAGRRFTTDSTFAGDPPRDRGYAEYQDEDYLAAPVGPGAVIPGQVVPDDDWDSDSWTTRSETPKDQDHFTGTSWDQRSGDSTDEPSVPDLWRTPSSHSSFDDEPQWTPSGYATSGTSTDEPSAPRQERAVGSPTNDWRVGEGSTFSIDEPPAEPWRIRDFDQAPTEPWRGREFDEPVSAAAEPATFDPPPADSTPSWSISRFAPTPEPAADADVPSWRDPVPEPEPARLIPQTAGPMATPTPTRAQPPRRTGSLFDAPPAPEVGTAPPSRSRAGSLFESPPAPESPPLREGLMRRESTETSEPYVTPERPAAVVDPIPELEPEPTPPLPAWAEHLTGGYAAAAAAAAEPTKPTRKGKRKSSTQEVPVVRQKDADYVDWVSDLRGSGRKGDS